jgi:putative ABC transport system permease protein
MTTRRKRPPSDFDAEIRAHLDTETDRLKSEGLADEDARHAAQRAFGNVLRVRERYYERGRWLWLDHLWLDLRYALRSFLSNPGHALAIVMTMALAIGAASAIFSIVNATLIRPLPYSEPDRLVGIIQRHARFGPEVVTVPDYQDWRDNSRELKDLAGVWTRVYNLTGTNEPERLDGAAVTPSLFTALRVPPSFGRPFGPQDEDPRTVVLSDRLWRRRFNADPNVVGRTVNLNGASHAVVAVMPPGFAWPESAELWVPLVVEPSMNRGYHTLQVIARLAPGATLASARAELETIAARAAAAHPEFNKDWGVEISSLLDYMVGPTTRPLLILAGAVLCVLLTACANVAGLLASRAVSRRREMALRGALGGSHSRVVRQLLTESLTLSIVGGFLGVTLASAAIDPLLSLTTLPRMREISVDVPVLIFCAIASLMTGIMFGLAPAISATRIDLRSALTDRSAGSGGWLRPALLAAEVAVAVVLLAGAALLMRSFVRLQQVETGFDSSRLLTVRFFMPRASYSVERCIQLYQEMLDRVKALPGVETASAVNAFPFSGATANVVFTVDGRPPAPPGEPLTANFNSTTPGFFETMGIPLVRGRAFDSSDRADGAFVAVVNRAMADEFFRGEDPLGKSVRILGPKPRTIVGIVENVRTRGFQAKLQPEIYVPHPQFPTGGMFLIVRSNTRDPGELAPSVRAAIAALDRDLPIANMRTGRAVLASTLSARRFNLLLMSMFAGTTLVLAILGVYSLQSYAVAQRTRELGIRVALGAARRDVVRLVVRQGMRPVVAGILAGLGVAMLATTSLTKMLFEISPVDPFALAGAVGVLMITALAAAAVPARRAARLDPMVAIRETAGE